MHLLNLFTCAKDALVPPEIFQVITADPLTCPLELISHRSHETMPLRQVILQLLPGDQRVSEKFEFVFLRLEQILEHHGALGRITGN